MTKTERKRLQQAIFNANEIAYMISKTFDDGDDFNMEEDVRLLADAAREYLALVQTPEGGRPLPGATR